MRRLRPVLAITVSTAFVLMSHPAEARSRDHYIPKHHHGFKKTSAQVKKYRLTRSTYFAKRYSHAKRSRTAASRSVSLAGVTPVLAAKAKTIVSDCGSTIISAVSGRGGRSNHPAGRAVDVKGNPRCIYGHLKGWPGGYSTDYAAVDHVHISYNPGGQEWGLHFAHNGGGHSYSHGHYAGRRHYASGRYYANRSLVPDGIQQPPLVYPQSPPVRVVALHRPR